MKHRKKLLATLLAGAMCLALSACGGGDTPASASPASSGAGTSASPSGEPLAADVQAIVDRGVLRVGVKPDVPGFGYQDVLTEEYSGMEVDLAHQIAQSLGVDRVAFTPVTAATRGQLLDSGDIDMVIATFTITDERRDSWNFTTPYYTDAVSLLVKTDSGIADYADLEGKVIGVSTGSTSMESLIAVAAENGVTLTQADNFSEYATYPEIKTALDAGRVDAFCVDGSILSGYLDDSVEILDSIRFSPQEYGIATALANTGLAEYLDELINTWLDDGTIDQMISDNGVAPSFEG
ncbi:MAG TPA: transporter substrate-binding domain-containing protein [Candidatus Enterenecus merdae]|nr:transporter substrate-binding domain-containing protein [Candidatus Enterenecus merdae]